MIFLLIIKCLEPFLIVCRISSKNKMFEKKPQFGALCLMYLGFSFSYHMISSDYEIVEKGIWH